MSGIWDTTGFLSRFPAGRAGSSQVPASYISEDSDETDARPSHRVTALPHRRPRRRCTDTHHHLKCGHTVRSNDPRCSRQCFTPRWGQKRLRRRKCSRCSYLDDESWLLAVLKHTDTLVQQLQDLRRDCYNMLPGASPAMLEEFEEGLEVRMTQIRLKVRPKLWNWYVHHGRAALEARVNTVDEFFRRAHQEAREERSRDREAVAEAMRAEEARQEAREERIRERQAVAEAMRAERARTTQPCWNEEMEEDLQVTLARNNAQYREQNGGEEYVRQHQRNASEAWDSSQSDIESPIPQAWINEMFAQLDAESGTEPNPTEAESSLSAREASIIPATVPTATAVRFFEENLNRLRHEHPDIMITPRREPSPASIEWEADSAAVAEELLLRYQQGTQVHLLISLSGGDLRILESLPLAYLAQVEEMLQILQEPVTISPTIPTETAVFLFEENLERLRQMHPGIQIPQRREVDPATIEWAGDPAVIVEEMFFNYHEPFQGEVLRTLCRGDLRVLECLPLAYLVHVEEIIENL